jgi:hypothetical protein
VSVGVREVDVRVRDMDPIDSNCKSPLRRLPRCTTAQVWKIARSMGATTDPNSIAKIAFLEDGKWFFDDKPHAAGGVKSFTDDCP